LGGSWQGESADAIHVQAKLIAQHIGFYLAGLNVILAFLT
jgi:hypothetical protein